MKRQKILSIALILGALLWSTSFALTAHGQQPKRKPIADTAVLTPAAGQTLRITVAPGSGLDDVSVVLAWKMYMPEGCSGTPAVCRHMVSSQGSTPVQMLAANDALSLDVPGTGNGLRLMVFANRDVQVLAQIIDSQGNVVVAFKPTADDSTVGQ